MRTKSLLCLLVTSLALGSAATLVGCGASSNQAKLATVKPGNLPDGASWDGVYFNRVWGYLHLKTEGETLKGRWKTADQSAWGEMKGTVTGNVVRFDWVEHKVGLVGPAGTRKGRGYFQYSRPEGDNVDDALEGSWGLGEAEVGGGEWNCVKQRNVKPDLRSIGSDAEPGVGGWN